MAEEVFSEDKLSGPERTTFASIKREVLDLGKRYGIIREKIAKIAPKVIANFKALDAKYTDLGGFIGYCRMIDPKVPTHAADDGDELGYRNHRTYQALDYMRRLVNAANRPPRDANTTQGARNPATDQLARLLASVLTIKGIDDAVVWGAVSQEFGMPAESRSLARLKARVEKTKPLIDLHTAAVKGEARIIPMRAATPKPSPESVMESLNRGAAAVGGRNKRVRVSA
jgi:hypothetical protein